MAMRAACRFFPVVAAAMGFAGLVGCAADAAGAPSAWRPTTMALAVELQRPARGLLATTADLAALSVCLVAHPTGQRPAGCEVEAVGAPTLAPAGDPRLRVRFTCVPANATGESYALAVAALDADGRNITLADGDDVAAGRVVVRGQPGEYYLSVTGGDEGPGAGSVRVEPGSYALSATRPLAVAIRLAP